MSRLHSPPSALAAGQLYAPNGKRIVATSDLIPGNAGIESVSRHENGALEIEWTGHTEMCWDGQYTELWRGQRIFRDECGNEWREKQLTLKPST